eukprot:CAMPEP_0179011792 /NCGR_PEP_ID=MMETSP0796-20121207/855_1 /TAXON_ID=73915 /ORGANISM="Pyrodinium bahamense, Strain pbaha01" /LENGTH=145 /DNA_ID=CAMNT_0020707199 /DNA_START=439 /DNA_END=877 /DNA_ORIENTATION=+
MYHTSLRQHFARIQPFSVKLGCAGSASDAHSWIELAAAAHQHHLGHRPQNSYVFIITAQGVHAALLTPQPAPEVRPGARHLSPLSAIRPDTAATESLRGKDVAHLRQVCTGKTNDAGLAPRANDKIRATAAIPPNVKTCDWQPAP